MDFEYKHPGRHSKCPSRSKLKELYIDMNLTSKQIGDALGVSPRTVEGWILKFRTADRERLAQLKEQ